jgi:Cof subfamily protein (haloacid dehalogenase superfamily)
MRAAVTDLDGTLVRSDGTLSSFTRQVLRESRRRLFPVVVATARTPRAVRRIGGYDDLGVMVCANGAIVWDAESDEIIESRCFEAGELSQALTRVRAVLPHAGLALLSSDRMFMDDAYGQLRAGPVRDGMELVADVTSIVGREPIAMVAVRQGGQQANEFVTAAGNAFGDTGTATFAGARAVDIHPAGVSKSIVGAELLGRYGIRPDAAVVFGDMPNDLPLFGWAGWACAVRNAHPDVLRADGEVVPSNDDDGVAITLQRLHNARDTAINRRRARRTRS